MNWGFFPSKLTIVQQIKVKLSPLNPNILSQALNSQDYPMGEEKIFNKLTKGDVSFFKFLYNALCPRKTFYPSRLNTYKTSSVLCKC